MLSIMKKLSLTKIILTALSICFHYDTAAFRLLEKGRGAISYERFLRLNEPENGGKRNTFDWLDTGYQYKLLRGPISGSFDGDFRFFINDRQFGASLGEAYFSYRGVDGSVHTLGRKRINWNPSEKFWQLNHFQGGRQFRLFDRKQEGLFGYHLKTNHGPLRGEYFLSYIYIPTLNPTIRVEDGNIISNSDWYRRPPEQAIIRASGVASSINYEVNYPSYADIITQKSIGGKLSYAWSFQDLKNEKKEIFGRGQAHVFAIYKPESSIRVNAAAKYNISEARLDVTADPVVNHHLVYGFSFEQEVANTFNRVGLTFVDPSARLGKDFDTLSLEVANKTSVDNRTGYLVDPKYDRETYLHFSSVLPGRVISATFHGVHYLTNHDRGNDDFYGDTVRWLSALGIGLTYYASDTLTANINFRYDFKRKDNLLDASVSLRPYKNTFVNMGIELISSPTDTSFWSPYRANDTTYIRLGLLF